jgi:hypothetical protein
MSDGPRSKSLPDLLTIKCKHCDYHYSLGQTGEMLSWLYIIVINAICAVFLEILFDASTLITDRQWGRLTGVLFPIATFGVVAFVVLPIIFDFVALIWKRCPQCKKRIW